MGVSYETDLPHEEKHFMIHFDPTSYQLYNFLIIHDFKENKGSISFRVTKGDIPNSIEVSLPSKLKFTNVSFRDIHNHYELTENENFTRKESYGDWTSLLILENFNAPLDSLDVKFGYEGEIIPNGKFLLEFHNIEKVRPRQGTFLEFKLDKYQCKPMYCFVTRPSFTYSPQLRDKIFTLEAIDENKKIRDISYEIFTLNMYDGTRQQIKWILIGIAIAILAEFLVLYLTKEE